MAAPTTSGTTLFNLDIIDLCEEAYERAGVEMRSGYDLKTARRSLQLLALEWANRGVNLWTVKEATVTLVASTDSYSLADDVIDVIEAVARTGTGVNQIDYTMTRISVSTYAQRTNKNTESRPTEYYVDRQNRATMTVWPVPENTDYTIQYWYLRRIEDAGTNTNNYDLPERFVPALIAGLAFNLALKRPELIDRVQTLKALYEEEFSSAANEDRSKAALQFLPFVEPVV
jgi:hypothetical protein